MDGERSLQTTVQEDDPALVVEARMTEKHAKYGQLHRVAHLQKVTRQGQVTSVGSAVDCGHNAERGGRGSVGRSGGVDGHRTGVSRALQGTAFGLGARNCIVLY